VSAGRPPEQRAEFLAHASAHLRGKPGRPRKPATPPVQTSAAPVARLLDLDGAAAYLAVSGWTVRDLEAAGVLRRVRVPLPKGGELRKLLFDRADLDHLIEAWKEAAR
jgi:hypothetical protein